LSLKRVDVIVAGTLVPGHPLATPTLKSHTMGYTLTSVYLIGGHLTGVHLIGVYLMGVYRTDVPFIPP
jgi:hypothetical protein